MPTPWDHTTSPPAVWAGTWEWALRLANERAVTRGYKQMVYRGALGHVPTPEGWIIADTWKRNP